MANCSFISATEARNLARNSTLLWTEICEVQTQILTAIDGNLYSVLVNDATPMTSLQSILSTTITNGGSNYLPVVATAVIDDGGTGGIGAAVTPVVTGTTITGFTIDNGGTPVLQTASVAVRGAGYFINDVLTVVGGAPTAATLTVTTLSTIASQDETDYTAITDDSTTLAFDGAGDPDTITGNGTSFLTLGFAIGQKITIANSENAGENDGTFTIANVTATVITLDAGDSLVTNVDDTTATITTGGSFNGIAATGAYQVSDVITLDDGSTITVDAVAGSDVTEFTVTTATTVGITGNLATLSQLGTVVGGGNGTGFTLTQQATNQSIFEVTIATGGDYSTSTPASPAATTAVPPGGTGATLNVTFAAGYAPVSVTASVDLAKDLIDAQTQVNFDNALPNGTFNAGDSYRIGEALFLVDNTRVDINNISATGVVTTQGQTQAVWTLTAGGDGAGGTAYVVADIITLNDGSTVTVDSIDGNGDVVNFTITTASTTSYTSGAILFQQGQVNGLGDGVGFTLTSAVGNEITVGSVTEFDTNSAPSVPYYATTLLQLSTDGIGSGFTLTPAGNNQVSVVQGTGVSLVVTETSGVITNVTAAGGSGYVVGATLTFTHPSGINAAATVTSVVGTVITGIIVSNGGSGYEQAIATVTVTAPGGLTPAVAFVGTVQTTSGSVTGISIQEGGSGYAELLPTINITDSDGGGGAVLTTNVAGGAVTAINIVNAGSGYTAPTLTIVAAPTSAGTGATATATVGANTFGTNPSDYNDVLIGQSSDAVITDQIQFVLDYFTALGYNIRAQTNSATANTMQWQIIW